MATKTPRTGKVPSFDYRETFLEGYTVTEEELISDALEEHCISIDEGMTNGVYETPQETIVKDYADITDTTLMQALGRTPGHFSKAIDAFKNRNLNLNSTKNFFHDLHQNSEDRIRRQEDFQDFTEEYELNIPELLNHRAGYLEFEKVEGQNIDQYLNSMEVDVNTEAENLGREVGSFLENLHSDGAATTELRINNFMIEDGSQYNERSDYEDPELAMVDGEFFIEDANSWEQEMDIITLMSSATQMIEDAYNGFREGFVDEYYDNREGEDLKFSSDVIKSGLSILHGTKEADIGRIKRGFSNGKNDLTKYLE